MGHFASEERYCALCGRRLSKGVNCGRCPAASRWEQAERALRPLSVEALSPADRIIAQDQLLKRWLALRCKRGTRRRTDGAGPVKRYDEKGQQVA